jgi:hypothetical protein
MINDKSIRAPSIILLLGLATMQSDSDSHSVMPDHSIDHGCARRRARGSARHD